MLPDRIEGATAKYRAERGANRRVCKDVRSRTTIRAAIFSLVDTKVYFERR